MRSVTFSQKGVKSEKNEDAFLSVPAKGLFVVADGVGGGPSGDFASRTMVETIYAELNGKQLNETIILQSINKANAVIFESAQARDLQGMATTVVVCWSNAEQFHCFNVGDSRIYRIRNGNIEQLTRDHTKQIRKAPNMVKQVVTNAIGIRPAVKIDVTLADAQEGDLLMLATDGVTDMLDDEAILSIVNSEKVSLVDKARALVAESERRGGQDDKSVILAVNA